MTHECVIYALRDPNTMDVRYVGQSRRGLQRARDHWRPSAIKKRENPHTANWLAKLVAAGTKPCVEVLEHTATHEELDEAETFWIAKAREMGYRLTNVLDGGNKPPLRVMPEAERRARSLRMKGHPGYWKGKKMSPEHLAKLSEAAKSHAPNALKFRCVDHLGNTYDSIREASRALGLPRMVAQNLTKGKKSRKFPDVTLTKLEG